MSGIFPNSNDGGLPPGADPLNPNHAYPPATSPLNTAALYYGNGCDVRLRPEVINSLISELEAVVDKALINYDSSQLTNLQFAVRYLIQRGFPRGTTLSTTGTVNKWNGVLDPVSTGYNDYETLSLRPSASNSGAVTLNLDGHGEVPLRRNDGAPLESGDITANVPFECIHWQGAFYMVGLVASQAGGGGGGAFLNGYAVYSTFGTYNYTVPAGVTTVQVLIWSAGGSGGGHGGGNGHGGSGGGGGGYAERVIEGLTPGAVITVTVGKGGSTATGLFPGATGGTSSFGGYVSATGGAGGNYGSTGTHQAGTGWVGDTVNNLSNGVGGDLNLRGQRGGQGGVAWIPNVWGIGGSGGAAAGGGGGPGPGTSSGGEVGTSPGGGGGGAGGGTGSSATSGAGADGMVVVKWVKPSVEGLAMGVSVTENANPVSSEQLRGKSAVTRYGMIQKWQYKDGTWGDDTVYDIFDYPPTLHPSLEVVEIPDNVQLYWRRVEGDWLPPLERPPEGMKKS